MNLTNISVQHIIFGTGIIIEHTGNYLTVAFQTKTAKFVYPDVFVKYMKATSPDIQSAINSELFIVYEECEKTKKTKDNERYAIHNANIASTPERPEIKQHIPSQRTNGKCMTYFVFQGKTFSKEYKGGYMWAPITNKVGALPHHWTRMTEVRKGDIIFHGCKGYIQAISVAKDVCYDCPQPKELTVEDMWDRYGRRIDCNYIYLNRPIKTTEFSTEISKYSQIKYSPFKSDGTGNMGYLFNLNRELAKLFARIAVERNPQLSSIDFIVELLSE